MAHEMAPGQVIVGEEIQTSQGEILAYFLSEEIPAGLEPEEVMRRLRAQKRFISVAHPFDPYLPRLPLAKRDSGKFWRRKLDGIEVFMPRWRERAFNHQARAFACDFGIPKWSVPMRTAVCAGQSGAAPSRV
jgi:predicted metal-dependent phosphoesterase TrpH